MTNPCCGLAVIFCGFISHLIGHKTINIPEIFSRVHSFTGKAELSKLDTFTLQTLIGSIKKQGSLSRPKHETIGRSQELKNASKITAS